ncbi:MAG: glycoside hydrolase [Spirochaetaceae bacterium]|jgi:spore germination protein YaaH|nr:glycoside hydrolase [Spirochaetaceae bacterium]
MKKLLLIFTVLLLLVSCATKTEIIEAVDNQQDDELLLNDDEVAHLNDNTEEEDTMFSTDFTIDTLPKSAYTEIWAYLIDNEEEYLKPDMPITDIGYFGAEFDSYGKLISVPNPNKIKNFSGRIHLVVCCNSRSLSHFVLEEGSKTRKAAIADLLAAAKNYDGLQIDFELVPEKDGSAFLSFLKELKAGLKGKTFSIALPARTRAIKNDVYDYTKIAPIVDRLLVMAYDEHWSTSKPGPIASTEWCKSICDYSFKTVDPSKLIMGIPFYGRTWGDISLNRAYFHSGIERVLGENGITSIQRQNDIPSFSYTTTVHVSGFYEDAFSISAKMELYRKAGITMAGFWRLGQETEDVWKIIEVAK